MMQCSLTTGDGRTFYAQRYRRTPLVSVHELSNPPLRGWARWDSDRLAWTFHGQSFATLHDVLYKAASDG
jgi:hypothetical protein